MVTLKIVNIIATTDIHRELDLNKILQNCGNCEYEPEQYHALIFRNITPKLSILVNASGKIIFTGGKTVDEIHIARDLFFKLINRLGYCPIFDEIIVHNYVVTLDFGHKICIENLSFQNFCENYQISKNQNRVIIRCFNPKFSIIIYKTGKGIINGIKEIDMISDIINYVEPLLIRELDKSWHK